MTPLRTLAFGELEPAGVWGAAWIPNSDGSGLTALGAGGASGALADVSVSAVEDGVQWRLDAGGAALFVSPAGEAVAVQASEGGLEGWDQLCRVSGRFEHGGTEHAVDCLGLRSWWSSPIELERYESIRAVSAWFEPDEGLTVTAFRPRKAKAHDQDVLAAAVIAPNVSATVEDPRLSTTYRGEGWPARAGIELWLAGDEPEHQYPRRASGEATGARVQALSGALEVRAEPFRWHSRGRDGAGAYILVRRR